MSPPVLTTERLRLRPLSVDDAAALHLIYADEQAMHYWSHGPHRSLAETRAKLESNTTNPDWRGWAIALHHDDTAIGTLAAHEKRQGRVVEIGYSLVRGHWGQGYAREAVARLIDHLFREEGIRRVCADTDPDNAGSNRLLESLGFVREGHLRGEWETHIGVRDSFIWGLLAKDWKP